MPPNFLNSKFLRRVNITHFIIFFSLELIHKNQILGMVAMERNIIGKKIKLIREKKEITQEQLTARLNVQGIEIDRPMISRIESQTRQILDFEIKAIANALGVSVEDLFKE